MYLFKIIIAIGIPVVLGYLTIETILLRKALLSWLEKLALAYAVGLGVLSLLMFFLSQLKIKFMFLSISAALLVVGLSFLWIYIKSFKASTPNLPKMPNRLSLADKILAGSIIFICLCVLFEAIIEPLAAWDAWAIYGFKAKVFYIEKTVPIDFFKDQTKAYVHFDYPLLLPLVEAWIYICLKSWNDQLVKIIFPIYFISLIIIFYYSLKSFIARKSALLFTLLLATIPYLIIFAGNGYADLPFIFYYFASLVLLLRACANLDKNLLLISAVCAGLAAWTKNEGLATSLFNIILLFIIISAKRKMSRQNLFLLLNYALIILIIIMPWLYFKSYLGLGNDVINPNNLRLSNIFSHLNKIPIILSWIGEDMKSTMFWNLLWWLSLATGLLYAKKIKMFPVYLISLYLTMYIVSLLFVYLINSANLSWHLATTSSRLLMQIVPLILFLDGLLIFKTKEE